MKWSPAFGGCICDSVSAIKSSKSSRKSSNEVGFSAKVTVAWRISSFKVSILWAKNAPPATHSAKSAPIHTSSIPHPYRITLIKPPQVEHLVDTVFLVGFRPQSRQKRHFGFFGCDISHPLRYLTSNLRGEAAHQAKASSAPTPTGAYWDVRIASA